MGSLHLKVAQILDLSFEIQGFEAFTGQVKDL